MVDIEWEAETITGPDQVSLKEFCADKGIPMPEADSSLPLVFVSTRALDDLLAFLASDTGREHGGVLVGLPFMDGKSGVNFIDVQAALPALDSLGSAVHMQFTGPDWTFISGMLADEYPGRVVVGWFHSHPALGIFMSGTDSATQRAFFNQPWHLAVVVDPLAHASGWFCGPDCIPLPHSQTHVYPVGGDGQQHPEAPTTKWNWLLPLILMFLAGIVLGWIAVGVRRV